jgi:hypothetical protein
MDMIEDVEKSFLRFFLAAQFLNVVEKKDVDILVETEEVVTVVLYGSFRILLLEEMGGNVEDTFSGEEGKYLIADGMTKMGLTHTRRAIEEKRVKGSLSGVTYDVFGSRSGEPVTFPFEEVVERIFGDKLGGELRRSGLRKGSVPLYRLLAWKGRGHRIGSTDEVGQGSVFSDNTMDGIPKDIYMVVFQILAEILCRYLKGKPSPLAGGRNDRGKPSVERLFRYFSLDVGKAFVPYDFVVGLHGYVAKITFPSTKVGAKNYRKKRAVIWWFAPLSFPNV